MDAGSLQTIDRSTASPGAAGDGRNLLERVFAGRLDAIRRVPVLGVGIDDLGIDDAIALLRAAVLDAGRRSLFIVNAHTLNLAAADATYRRVLGRSTFVFNDGTGVRLAARLGGVRLRANLNGTDLVPALMAATDADGLRVFLVGATDDVLARTQRVIARRFPGWTVAGSHHGFLDQAASDAVVAAIAEAKPHLLLVAMGNPIQERWIDANRHRLAANLSVGVGGLFAYLCGDYRRAPPVMRRIGCEWLVVLLLQRQKWRRYVFGNPVFIARAMRWHLLGKPEDCA